MKSPAAAIFLAAAPGLMASPGKSQPSPLDWNPAAESPRSRAIEIAGAGEGTGYIARDGYWLGTLEKQKPVLVAVDLFAGNSYRFSAAALDPSVRLRVSVFDGDGQPAGSESTLDSPGATASVTPVRNGRFFVRLLMTEGDKAETCMVYFFK